MDYISYILMAACAVLLLARGVLLPKAKVVAVDDYFWQKYRRQLRHTRQFPPVLKEYLLDVRQWYLPVYGKLISLMPNGLFSHGFLVTQVLSIMRLCLMYVMVRLCGFDPGINTVLLALLVYLSSPILVTYDNQLNSRIVGAILFDVLIFLIYRFVGQSFDVMLVSGICLLFLSIVFTHKLTMQLLIFLLIVLALSHGAFLLPVVFVTVVAFAYSCLGLKKHLVAHAETTRFWNRNRHLLSAHQIKESPIYGQERENSTTVGTVVTKLTMIYGLFPFLPLFFSHTGISPFWLVIALATVGFALLTTFVPFLICWGNGRSYTYYLPSILLMGLFTSSNEPNIITVCLLFAMLMVAVAAMVKFYRYLSVKLKEKDEDLDEMLTKISESDIDRVMVVPITISDEISGRTGKAVLWGAHGYGILWVEPYFPVLRTTVEQAVNDWNLGGMLLNKSYWPDFYKQVDQSVFSVVHENGKYIFLKVVGWAPGNRIPVWAREMYPTLRDTFMEDEV